MKPILALALALLAHPLRADVLVQSTTSTANSGLYDYLLPIFREETGIVVNVVAVGTGQAIRNAWNCDADVLLVHDRAAEEAFVAEGGGTGRHDLMYNDFVLVGPSDDPAGVAAAPDVAAALSAIARTGAAFASRGDDSGTHRKEQALWQAAGVEPAQASGDWYLESGSGMGATLNLAAGRGAYALTDRATWLTFANKGDLRILSEGDPRLFNPYGVIAIDPARCPEANADEAQVLIDWLTGPRGQAAIAAFRVGGRQLFFPAADG